MQLPSIAAPDYLILDPSRKFVNFNQSAYPTIKALSAVNRSTDTAIIQNTSSAQPTWSVNALAGTYVARNNPGSQVTPAGIPGFTFSGAQYFEADSVSGQFSGTETGLAVVCQVECLTAGGTIWSLGSSSGTTPKLSLSFSGGTLSFVEVNSSGTFTASATLNNNVHCVSCIRTNNALVLRVDSTVVAGPTAITAAASTYNTFCIGCLNSNGSVSSYFNGVIGSLLVYGAVSGSTAMPDIYDVETSLLIEAGVIRGASAGINTGF